MAREGGFHDHFSGHAGQYALARPRYPPALFAWLASLAPARERAWDCGTGNGQCAVGLAEHFAEVVATDPSEPQLRHAFPHPRVRYAVAAAERSGLEDATVDLVTVAQALHWFDLPRFWGEARRVLRPGGALAAWSYGLFTVDPAVDAVIGDLWHRGVGAWWPPERALVDDGYRSIDLPFAEIDAPPFAMEHRWTLADVLNYLRTWSAVQRYLADRGTDPVTAAEPALRDAWGDPTVERLVTWPIAIRAGRVEG